MATDYLFALKNAVVTALAADTTLAAMVNGIYDNVLADAKFPFVAVDNITAKNENSRTTSGFAAGINIRAHSRARTSQEVSNITAEIRRVVLAATLSPAGCSVSAVREDGGAIARASDGVTWHGNINFAVLLQQGGGVFVASGNNFIIKIGDGATPTENFTTIGGLRNASLNLANKTLDATSLSSGRWREIVSGAGIAAVAVSGDGFFTDSAAEEALRAKAFNGALNNYQILLGSGDKITGKFMVASYARSGKLNAEEEVGIKLESGGEVVFG